MALVGFAPKQEYRDDPSRLEVLHITDGPKREWFLDTGHLAGIAVTVLDTYTDAPIIRALDEYDAFMRVPATEATRTLPGTLDEMNQQQLLATHEGNQVEGGADLSRSKLRSEMAKVRKAEDAATEDAVATANEDGTMTSDGGDAFSSEAVGPSPTTNPYVKHDAELGGAATGESTDDRETGPTVETIKGAPTPDSDEPKKKGSSK